MQDIYKRLPVIKEVFNRISKIDLVLAVKKNYSKIHASCLEV